MTRSSLSLRVFSKCKRRYIGVGIFASLVAIGSFFLAYYGWGILIKPGCPWPRIKVAEVIVLLAWTLLPPIWFWYEYWYMYLADYRPGHKTPDDLELFKYGQDVSSKIWVAAASSMFVLYFWKDIHL
jgi:hypothetical protein